MAVYGFPSVDRFLDRDDERRALESWRADEVESRAMAIYGRRRVGKSWLVRAFAHGREADVFVADTRALPDQLAEFAIALERDGERPALPDLGSFFRLLYRRARTEQRVAVIDELPQLWKVDRSLPSVLMRIMEEEASGSRLKLIVAGSHVGMMERLLEERAPLHDRLQPLRVRPLDLWQAIRLLGEGPAERSLTAYGLAGGMPRYLTDLAGAIDPAARLAELTLDPYGPLFNEPRSILGQELDTPHVYFSLLAALAEGPQPWGEIVKRSRVEPEKVGRYIATLQELDIVVSNSPVTDLGRETRARLYAISDGFLRFWFRFVFPFQADLESGLDRQRLFESRIRPALADHLAPAFENVCRDWVRREGLAGVDRVGGWWGPALHALRRTGARTTEEIDVVGLLGRRVVLVGEVRWQSAPMDVGVLGDLERYKVPALAQTPGIEVEDQPVVVLVSRSGFTRGLQAAATRDVRIRLVDCAELVRSGP